MVERVVVEIERGKRGERERKEEGRRRVNVVLERGTETRPHGSSVSQKIPSRHGKAITVVHQSH